LESESDGSSNSGNRCTLSGDSGSDFQAILPAPISKAIFEPFLWQFLNGLHTHAEQLEPLSQFFTNDLFQLFFFVFACAF